MTQVFRELSPAELDELDRRAREQGAIPEMGEVVPPVTFSREVGPYQAPTMEQFTNHDIPQRGESMVPIRVVKLIVRYILDDEGRVVAERTAEERARVADQLTLYMDGPAISSKQPLIWAKYMGIHLRMIGGFEFLLPPFEKLDPATKMKITERNAKVQKLHVRAMEGPEEGKEVMLRFGAESAGLFIAKWTAAYRDFDFEDDQFVDVRITQQANNMYSFERVK